MGLDPRTLTLMRIRIRILPFNLIRHPTTQFFSDCDHPINDPKASTFHFDADPDPAFLFDEEPDPASQNDAGPCGSGPLVALAC